MKTVIGDVYKNTCSCGHRLWINSKAAVFSLSIIVTIALCAIPKSFLSFLLLCCCWTWRNHIPLAVAVHAAHMNLFCVLPKNMWSQCLTFRFYRCSVWVGSFCCHSSDWLVLFALFSLPGLFFFSFSTAEAILLFHCWLSERVGKQCCDSEESLLFGSSKHEAGRSKIWPADKSWPAKCPIRAAG